MNNATVWQSIRRGAGLIARPQGRDSRAQFWPYAVAVWLGVALLSVALAVPYILSTLTNMARLAAQYPDQFVVLRGPGSIEYRYIGNDPAITAQLMPDMAVVALITLVVFGLSAAAVVRRLHDRGWSGWWCAVPMVLALAGYANMAAMFGQIGPHLDPNSPALIRLFLQQAAINITYLISVAILLVQLARPGVAGDNLYGPPTGGTPP
ncbi:MAG: DUF805 domain-containing protein, partial [Sphingopyxis sp.]